MELDREKLWGVQRAYNQDDINSAQKVRFKTPGRDEVPQEFLVPKDNGEHGAKWSVDQTYTLFKIAMTSCLFEGPAMFSAFIKCLGGHCLTVWLLVLEMTEWNSDDKRTKEAFVPAWQKWFEKMYNLKNARDVQLRGYERREFKKPLLMSPNDFERRWSCM